MTARKIVIIVISVFLVPIVIFACFREIGFMLEGNVEIVMTKDGVLIRNPKYELVARETTDK